MTTPAQWLDRLADGAPSRPAVVRLAEADVAAIQADALRHAASLVHSISRGTKSKDRAIAIDEAAELLIGEANLFGAPGDAP